MVDLILPEQSKLVALFDCPVSHNVNGPLYRFYPQTETSVYQQFLPLNYNYLVPILVGGKRGGKEGHYHLKKHEIFCLLEGRVELYLEDVITKELERIEMQPLYAARDKHTMLGIKTNIAHHLINVGQTTASLLVFSNRDSQDYSDEIDHAIDRR